MAFGWYGIGLLMAFLGTVPWIIVAIWPQLIANPGDFHARTMILGFCAFLVTQRFKMGPKPALLWVWSILIIGFSAWQNFQLNPVALCFFGILMGDLTLRQYRYQRPPLPGLTLTLLTWGGAAIMLAFTPPAEYATYTLAYNIFNHGAILALMVPLTFAEYQDSKTSPAPWIHPFAQALVFACFATFVLEAQGFWALGRWIRCGLAATLLGIILLRQNAGSHYGAILALLCLTAGTAIAAQWPAATLHAFHLQLAGGAALLLLQAPLAGRWGQLPRKLGWAAVILTIIAATTRFYAGISDHSYTNHLAYAAVIWIAALVCWIVLSRRAVKLFEKRP